MTRKTMTKIVTAVLAIFCGNAMAMMDVEFNREVNALGEIFDRGDSRDIQTMLMESAKTEVISKSVAPVRASVSDIPLDGTCRISTETIGPSICNSSLFIEIDAFDDSEVYPECQNIVRNYLKKLGADVFFAKDEFIGLDDLKSLSWLEMQSSSSHFDHIGQKGWHHLILANSLPGDISGWGEMNGYRLALAKKNDPKEQAKILLHELGHNFGLTHSGFGGHLDEGSNKTTCVMYSQIRQPDEFSHLEPVLHYCSRCQKELRKLFTSDRQRP